MPVRIVPDVGRVPVGVARDRLRCAAPGPGTTATIGKGRLCASRAGLLSGRGRLRFVPAEGSATTGSPSTGAVGCVEWSGDSPCCS